MFLFLSQKKDAGGRGGGGVEAYQHEKLRTRSARSADIVVSLSLQSATAFRARIAAEEAAHTRVRNSGHQGMRVWTNVVMYVVGIEDMYCAWTNVVRRPEKHTVGGG